MKVGQLWPLVLAGSLWLHPGACQEAPLPPATLKPAIVLGQDLYQRLCCRGCHTLQGNGGAVGPVLDGVGRRLSREELETQLLTPRRRHPDSRMPSFAFVRPFELQALLDFMKSLK